MSFVIIHLTDIHMSSIPSENYLGNKQQQLVSACLSTICPGDVVTVACTGDYAFSGSTDQYLLCLDLFDSLKINISAASGSEPCFIMVPGNHDCDFGDKDQEETRNKKLDLIDKRKPNTSQDDVHYFLSPQSEFFSFAKSYDRSANLCVLNTFTVELSSQKILFIKLNTALASRKKEISGSLVLPTNYLTSIKSEEYSLVIAMMHHSTSWMHADHATDVNDYLRKTADIILVGHDHRNDAYQVMGSKFSNYIIQGKNLQGDSPSESGFSVLVFNDRIDSVRSIEFSYCDNEHIYRRIKDSAQEFCRNSCIQDILFRFNDTFLNTLTDVGSLVRHPAKERIVLPDIYCWPDFDIDVLDKEKYDAISMPGNKDATLDHILENEVVFVVGEKLSGKTSFARMLAIELYGKGMLPVLCDGDIFTSPMEAKLESAIESSFVDEYCDTLLERFRQQNYDRKVLIIDRFDSIGNKERRDRTLEYACKKFKHVVVLSNIDSYTLLAYNLSCPNGKSLSALKIRMMSNSKRAELINKWYALSRDDIPSNAEYDYQVATTISSVTSSLGRLHGYTPAFPLYVLNMIMVLNSGDELTHGLTKSGYIYDDIIRRSINSIDLALGDDITIDMEILGIVAYYLLKSQNREITFEKFSLIVNQYNVDYTSRAESARLIRRMKDAGILKEVSRNTYSFSYPFIFYYFSARYIADRVSEQEIVEQIEHMSKFIYVEAYGNILIFVCHFTKDRRVINAVISNAKMLFAEDDEFDYTKYTKLINETIASIDSTFKQLDIGSDGDVGDYKARELKIKDSIGESDGSVDEDSTMDMTEESTDQRMSEISNGIKTIDILGQIIRNYTGKLNAQAKSEIISEMHSVSMRMLNSWNVAFDLFQSEFVEFCIEQAEKEFPGKATEQIAKRAKEFLCVMLTTANYSQIHNVSLALSKETLIPACEETLGKNSGISGKLILLDLKMNCLGRQPVDEAIDLFIALSKVNNIYAAQIVRLIVWQFARRTHISHVVRDKIRQAFNFIPSAFLQSDTNEPETA